LLRAFNLSHLFSQFICLFFVVPAFCSPLFFATWDSLLPRQLSYSKYFSSNFISFT
jgi:hypothetical protein